MLNWTPAEEAFLRSQRIGRLATVGPNGWPHAMPVMYTVGEDCSFEFDADGVKLRNLLAEPRVAFVVDAIQPKRGIAIQGRAHEVGPERVRLVADRRFCWGL